MSSLAATTTMPTKRGVACTHCSLAVPRGLICEGESEQFCCEGCRAAHAIITGCGLGQYYKHRETIGAPGRAARSARKSYAEFDDEAFRARWCQRNENGLASVELCLEGVHCAACVWLIERLERLVEGVVSVRLDIGRSIVRIVWDDSQASLSKIAKTLDTLGYRPHAARGAAAKAVRVRENRAFLIRIAVAGLLAGNVMLVSIALYGDVWGTMEPAYATLFRWTAAALGMLSLVWPGAVFFRGALGAIRARGWNLDMPIAAALAVGGISGLINTIWGSGEIYFDSLTMLVFLLLFGRWLQVRQQRSALDAVELMTALTPRRVRIIEDDVAREASIESVESGTILEVLAEESVPADGVVVLGSSTIDEAVLTGEPMPVPVVVGDRVSAGSVNLSGTIRMRTEATGESTRIGRVMRQVEELSTRKGRVQTRADRLAGWFVLGVTSLAGVTLAVWWQVNSSAAVEHAVALMIVTCPCALALATPLASSVAIGRAARSGVLVKGADALDGLARPGLMLLDKTGTITVGRFQIVRWIGDESVREAVSALESHSGHPIARALAKGSPSLGVREAHQHAGLGITGIVADDLYVVGSSAILEKFDIDCPSHLCEAADAAQLETLTPVFVAKNGRAIAVAALGDEIRGEAIEAVVRLKRTGWRIGILSGDGAGVVERVARAVGIDPEMCFSQVTPEGKVECVNQELQRGAVVMVGDGVNDAAALAAASVGIAVQGGAEASLDAADIYVGGSGLGAIPEVTAGSARTARTIRRCLIFSLGYNFVAAGLAVAGAISPLVGAVLMPMSSLTVLTIAIRSRSFGP